jgi:Zn-dependent M16 (insulinase) family peptidase
VSAKQYIPTPSIELESDSGCSVSDDDGCAHSLEHLIFHGSEAHPYTDSLYSIASRYFTATLNAFTRQNCTQYSIQTAGEYSFLKMLPIYVEHILYPCLAHNDFITEVFHVDHDGHDAGVVYSEVQGKGITSAAVMEDS